MRRATTLHARSASEAVLPLLASEGGFGRVESVFDRAVNLRCPAAPGGLVAVVDPGLGLLPYGIACARPTVASSTHAGRRAGMHALGLVPGMVARADRGDLVIEAAGVRVVLGPSVDRFSPRLGPLAAAEPSAVAERVRHAEALAASAAPAVGLGPLLRADPADRGTSPFASRAIVVLAAVRDGLERGDAAAAVAAAEPLVGLGEGLTPSGDDVLVGLAAALAATAHPLATDVARGWAALAPGRTTSVATALLVHAGRLEFAGALRDLLTALLSGGPHDVRREVGTVLEWGASSGADTLVGVLAGVRLAARSASAGPLVAA